MEIYLILSTVLLGFIMLFSIHMVKGAITNSIIAKSQAETKQKMLTIATPLKLQAYERMCLFLERIAPGNLLLRLVPAVETASQLQQMALHEIREEYNHNAAQQIYLSPQAWELIGAAMNQTVALINELAGQTDAAAPAQELARRIMAHVVENDIQPTVAALEMLRKDVRTIIG